jgi:hypothetical protein
VYSKKGSGSLYSYSHSWWYGSSYGYNGHGTTNVYTDRAGDPYTTFESNGHSFVLGNSSDATLASLYSGDWEYALEKMQTTFQRNSRTYRDISRPSVHSFWQLLSMIAALLVFWVLLFLAMYQKKTRIDNNSNYNNNNNNETDGKKESLLVGDNDMDRIENHSGEVANANANTILEGERVGNDRVDEDRLPVENAVQV